MTTTIYTIGHSNHVIEDFIMLLKAYNIEKVLDIRTIPKSHHNPQFNQDALREVLHNHHIHYHHVEALGGLRHARKDSLNTAWRNASFRGFADYMQTPEFVEAVDCLVEEAQREQIVLMCAEAVPWRCHRSLIADALIVRHCTVIDIYTVNTHKEHTLTPWAHVHNLQVTYPAKE
jgi:uncharacterized protein (DUF488 family)